MKVLTGLLIVFVLTCLIAGALANWHVPEPHIPAIGSFKPDSAGLHYVSVGQAVNACAPECQRNCEPPEACNRVHQ